MGMRTHLTPVIAAVMARLAAGPAAAAVVDVSRFIQSDTQKAQWEAAAVTL